MLILMDIEGYLMYHGYMNDIRWIFPSSVSISFLVVFV